MPPHSINEDDRTLLYGDDPGSKGSDPRTRPQARAPCPRDPHRSRVVTGSDTARVPEQTEGALVLPWGKPGAAAGL